jgi:hypothetical protein
MTTGFIDDARRDEAAGPRSASWTVKLLLWGCGVISLLLVVGGGGFIGPEMLRAGFWALVAGLAAAALIFAWRAARLLRMIHR